jgi:hypothetical protein
MVPGHAKAPKEVTKAAPHLVINNSYLIDNQSSEKLHSTDWNLGPPDEGIGGLFLTAFGPSSLPGRISRQCLTLLQERAWPGPSTGSVPGDQDG